MPKPTQASRLTNRTRPQLMVQIFSGSVSSRRRPRSRCDMVMPIGSSASRRDPVGNLAPGYAAPGIALLDLDQDIGADRRGHRRAAACTLAAVLHHDRTDVARGTHGGEGHEQRMVALEPRHLLRLQHAALVLG